MRCVGNVACEYDVRDTLKQPNPHLLPMALRCAFNGTAVPAQVARASSVAIPGFKDPVANTTTPQRRVDFETYAPRMQF